jgi:DNA polymerase I-like protein with 3'-5' exonuclease and polymerase domains
VWLRGLIKPGPGHGIAYIDWEQQEFGIAAVLSGDAAMLAAYKSGDPYLEFAKQAGAVPHDATKKTHKFEREQHKQCVLAVQYGQEADGLAERLRQPRAVAQQLLRMHHRTYHVFWAWSDRVVYQAQLHRRLWATMGWQWQPQPPINVRSVRNFPMQANGAEMLRLACCFGDDAGIEICAPVHDAVLIHAPIERIAADVESMRKCMAEASRVILRGFELRTEEKTFIYPARYWDERGDVMWKRIMQLIGEPNDIKSEGL